MVLPQLTLLFLIRESLTGVGICSNAGQHGQTEVRYSRISIGVSREKIHAALEAEGVTGLAAGYVNVHLLPMYQKKIAYGSNGFPWSSDICKRDVSYAKGICPVAEEFDDKTFLGFEMCLHELEDDDVDMIVVAFRKLWENLDHLATVELY